MFDEFNISEDTESCICAPTDVVHSSLHLRAYTQRSCQTVRDIISHPFERKEANARRYIAIPYYLYVVWILEVGRWLRRGTNYSTRMQRLSHSRPP